MQTNVEIAMISSMALGLCTLYFVLCSLLFVLSASDFVVFFDLRYEDSALGLGTQSTKLKVQIFIFKILRTISMPVICRPIAVAIK